MEESPALFWYVRSYQNRPIQLGVGRRQLCSLDDNPCKQSLGLLFPILWMKSGKDPTAFLAIDISDKITRVSFSKNLEHPNLVQHQSSHLSSQLKFPSLLSLSLSWAWKTASGKGAVGFLSLVLTLFPCNWLLFPALLQGKRKGREQGQGTQSYLTGSCITGVWCCQMSKTGWFRLSCGTILDSLESLYWSN